MISQCRITEPLRRSRLACRVTFFSCLKEQTQWHAPPPTLLQDIARTVIDQYLPRSRLDAATFGTMGLGLGCAIAAQVYQPERTIVCIEGDSAWGFSAMELETACRHTLPILFIIINNNGIYTGMDAEGIIERFLL